MAEYTAREWSNGDIVTAANLNQIENGIEDASGSGSEPLVIHFTGEPTISGNYTIYTTDTTYADIINAITNGAMVYLLGSPTGRAYDLLQAADGGSDVNPYTVYFSDVILTAESENSPLVQGVDSSPVINV